MKYRQLLIGSGALIGTSIVLIAALFAAFYVPKSDSSVPRVLVSVDRTVWNAIGLNQLTYVRKLRLAGVEPVLVRFGDRNAQPSGAFEGISGVVLTGGGDVDASRYGGDPAVARDVNRARDAFEVALLRVAESMGLPVLGLCRGAQLINVARGGTLGDIRHEPRYRAHRTVMGGHAIQLKAGSMLESLFGANRLENVTTWHGQHVKQPGNGVEVTAFSPDGIPEAIEVRGAPFIVGVQWHAEMPPWDEVNAPLFGAFARAALDAQVSQQAATNPSNSRR